MSGADIETPFPIEGSIQLDSEAATGWSLPCMSEWLSEHESGNVLERIKQEMRTHHEPGVKADFTVYGDGTYELENIREMDDDE